MKRTLSLTLKLLAWTGLVTIVLVTGCYLGIKSSWTDVFSEKQIDKLASEIIAVQSLPANFKKTLTLIYPDIFDNGLTANALDQLLTTNDNQPCPCRQVAMTLRIDHAKAKRALRNFYPASLTWAIERRVSQEQCMAYYLDRYDFTRGIIGIDQASEFYFNEKLDNLTINQQLELILKLKNPLLYDKARRPDMFDIELRKLKEKVTGYNNGYTLPPTHELTLRPRIA